MGHYASGITMFLSSDTLTMPSRTEFGLSNNLKRRKNQYKAKGMDSLNPNSGHTCIFIAIKIIRHSKTVHLKFSRMDGNSMIMPFAAQRILCNS